MACGEIGLDVNYFYKLTQRQLYNIINGYRKKEDLLSRERWCISRKIMFSYLRKYMGEHAKETDIIVFPWEEGMMKKIAEEEQVVLEQSQKESDVFWLKWDKRKKGEA